MATALHFDRQILKEAYGFVAGRSIGRVEIYIDRGDKITNRHIFDSLHNDKGSICKEFGGDIIWEPLDEKRACRIKAQIDGSIYNEDDWPQMIEFMVSSMIKLEKVRVLTKDR